MTEAACRCGWDGTGDHPCHGRAYECKKPARSRSQPHQRYSLAGAMLKLSVVETFACDECWEEFKAKLAAAKKE